MATLYTLRSGATQHPEGMMGFFASRMVTVAGTFDKDSDHFKCEQQSTPDMTVKVNDGYAFIPLSDLSFVHPVELDGGDGSVTISANSSGNDRIDAIVLYIDRSASANTTGTNVATLYVVEGTPAGSPSAPTDNEIQTEIGASNPFLRLADVTVENGTSDIQDGDITDQRVDATFSDKIAGGDWADAGETWTYSSWDDTNGVSTGVVTIATGGADRYTAGMKFKLTQPTDGTKYGFITKVTDTTLTLFFNTDYDFDNEAITSPQISKAHAPQGFDLDPSNYEVLVEDTTNRSQSSPVANTWYNLGSQSIDVPIGDWNVSYRVYLLLENGSNILLPAEVTLSDANNTESDANATCRVYGYGTANGSTMMTVELKNLTTKDTFYLNSRATASSIATLFNVNGQSTLRIRARIAYLA